MKARLSHCIGRLLPFAAAIMVCAGAQAQVSRYDRLERRNLWNAGENVAALRLDSLSYAEAALGARYEAGAFRSMSDASSLWGAGVLARAVSTLEGFSMRGSFGFENTEGYDMCGSMFMQPGFFPVDVMEFTPGRKSFQKYTLSGGIAVPLSDNWAIGADMDFASANAAKRKDLRYTGYRLDFSFAPSLLYSSGPFRAGLSLLYGRNTEKIDAEQIGSAQTAPMAFFNEGLYYGNYQVWTGSGTRLDESGVSGLPLIQNSFGAALQTGLRSGSSELYADISLSCLKGRAGERQTVWYRYRGPLLSARLGLRSGAHTLRSEFRWKRITNRESVLDKVVQGGVTTTVEYASNRIFTSNELGLRVEYEFLSPRFELRPSVELADRQGLAQPLYPYVAAEELRSLRAGLEALLRFGSFGFAPEVSWYCGSIDASGDAPGRMEELYALACEYETAPRLSAGAELRLDFAGRFFAAVSGGCVKAFGVEHMDGSVRWGAGLKIGMDF